MYLDASAGWVESRPQAKCFSSVRSAIEFCAQHQFTEGVELIIGDERNEIRLNLFNEISSRTAEKNQQTEEMSVQSRPAAEQISARIGKVEPFFELAVQFLREEHHRNRDFVIKVLANGEELHKGHVILREC